MGLFCSILEETFDAVYHSYYNYYYGAVRQKKAKCKNKIYSKIVSEYDQEIPQTQTSDNPVAPRGRAAQPSRDTRKTN